jgi:hypothetical protein
MELLATAQPWNLLLFMAIPVILAETVAICELYLLFTRRYHGGVHALSRAAGATAGVYFLGVFAYLMWNAVIPLTAGGLWRGPADVIAVLFYLSGVIPLGGVALIEFGLLRAHESDESKLKLHATFVAIFLVVAHVAMIFGMLNPTVLGWSQQMAVPQAPMDGMESMETMHHQ